MPVWLILGGKKKKKKNKGISMYQRNGTYDKHTENQIRNSYHSLPIKQKWDTPF